MLKSGSHNACAKRNSLFLSMWRWKTHKVHIKAEWNAHVPAIVMHKTSRALQGKKSGLSSHNFYIFT